MQNLFGIVFVCVRQYQSQLTDCKKPHRKKIYGNLNRETADEVQEINWKNAMRFMQGAHIISSA